MKGRKTWGRDDIRLAILDRNVTMWGNKLYQIQTGSIDSRLEESISNHYHIRMNRLLSRLGQTFSVRVLISTNRRTWGSSSKIEGPYTRITVKEHCMGTRFWIRDWKRVAPGMVRKANQIKRINNRGMRRVV